MKNPADDAALYQIACCYAKLEKKDKMLQYLKRAINIDRENANEALHDDDFSKYKDDKDFKTLVFFEHSA